MARLWAGSAIPVVLAVPAGKENELKSSVDQAHRALTEAGVQVELLEGFNFYPDTLSDKYFRDYGVIALALPRDLRKDSLPLNWFVQAKAPAIIMFY